MVGKIRHRFYTYDDSVTLSPEGLGEIKMPVMHRVRSQTAEGLPLEQIIDHSAIVGAAKSIEFIDTSGEIVYTSKPTYRFSEDLNDHEGALFASLDNRLPADKPVGLVRERTVRMQHRIAEEPEDAEDQQDEDIWFVRRGVTDMIRSSLFMVREDKTYDRNGVTVSVRKGLFDAYRGAAMAELRTNYDSDGQKHGLLSIEAPTTYVETGNRLTGLKKKNIYTHSAFTMSAQPATVGFPLTIQEVIAQQNETGYSVLQAGATGWSVEPFDSSAEVPYDQWRYYKDTSYVWGGAPTFASRDLMPEQWIARSRVQSIDQLSRPRTVVDAHGVPATFVTHPFRADPAAIADNAGYEETAVFTCDYDDYQRGEPSPDGTYLLDAPYFDLSNGWEKGETNLLHLLVPPTCEVSTDMPHFGDATLFIENARGPLATRRVRPGKTYQMSAWVKVVEGTLIMSADYRVSNRTEGEEEWPYTDSSHLVNAAGEPATVVRYVEAGDDWQYVEMEVPTEGLDPNEKWFVRISLGNGKGDINSDDGHVTAYVDDIRFHPSDALVRTYRYDRNMGLLIAVVDANNQADYFEYDPFGRLTGKGRYTSTQ